MTDDNSLNIDAIVGLAVATAFFRLEYTNSSTIDDVEGEKAWGEIGELAASYLSAAGVPYFNVTKEVIVNAIWGDID